MNNLEKRFLFDSRFTGEEKLFCMLCWANNIALTDSDFQNAIGLRIDEILKVRNSLIKKKVLEKFENGNILKSLDMIYG
jgi:hypothetical protein